MSLGLVFLIREVVIPPPCCITSWPSSSQELSLRFTPWYLDRDWARRSDLGKGFPSGVRALRPSLGGTKSPARGQKAPVL